MRKVMAAAGNKHEFLRGKELRHRFPMIQLPDLFEAVYEYDAGFLKADQCLRAYLVRSANTISY